MSKQCEYNQDKSKWQKFEEYVGLFFIAIFLLICIIIFFYSLIILIENPISLAIICLTIFLFWIWSSR